MIMTSSLFGGRLLADVPVDAPNPTPKVERRRVGRPLPLVSSFYRASAIAPCAPTSASMLATTDSASGARSASIAASPGLIQAHESVVDSKSLTGPLIGLFQAKWPPAMYRASNPALRKAIAV